MDAQFWQAENVSHDAVFFTSFAGAERKLVAKSDMQGQGKMRAALSFMAHPTVSTPLAWHAWTPAPYSLCSDYWLCIACSRTSRLDK